MHDFFCYIYLGLILIDYLPNNRSNNNYHIIIIQFGRLVLSTLDFPILLSIDFRFSYLLRFLLSHKRNLTIRKDNLSIVISDNSLRSISSPVALLITCKEDGNALHNNCCKLKCVQYFIRPESFGYIHFSCALSSR